MSRPCTVSAPSWLPVTGDRAEPTYGLEQHSGEYTVQFIGGQIGNQISVRERQSATSCTVCNQLQLPKHLVPLYRATVSTRHCATEEASSRGRRRRSRYSAETQTQVHSHLRNGFNKTQPWYTMESRRARKIGRSYCRSHLDAEEIAQADLIDVVGDVLIVHKTRAGNVGRARGDGHIRLLSANEDTIATHHLDALERGVHDTSVLPLRRPSASLSPRREHALLLGGLASGVGGVRELLEGIAEFGLTQKEKRGVVREIRAAVVGRLGRHVREVDTLAELA